MASSSNTNDSPADDGNRIASVDVDDEHILLTLMDGRVLSTDISRYIRVEKATPQERLGWTLTEDGRGLNWPALWPPAERGMVSVWEIEQDALYTRAMERLHAAQWDLSALSQDERELVALWRLEADVNNGGFLQFFCNWGEETCALALLALERIGADAARRCLRRMRDVIAHYGARGQGEGWSDLPALLTDEESDRLETLDEEFWDYPDPLDALVVRRYGSRLRVEGA